MCSLPDKPSLRLWINRYVIKRAGIGFASSRVYFNIDCTFVSSAFTVKKSVLKIQFSLDDFY